MTASPVLKKADLITHPVRSRIMATLMGRNLTTQQIAALLPDIPLPSVYRHVRLLAENDILSTIEEIRVNGALTKVYGVAEGQGRLGSEDVQNASQADHLRYFTTFLNNLERAFRDYLAQDPNAPDQTWFHATMGALAFTEDEFHRFRNELRELFQRWEKQTAESELPPGSERRRLILAHLAMPDKPEPPD